MVKRLPRLLLVCFLCSSCAIPLSSQLPNLSSSFSGGQIQEIQASTSVSLASDNYRILKTNVVGSDWGISFLGILPIVSPDSAKAMAKLYKAGGVSEGKPQAIVNLLQQSTSPYFILFSIPKIMYRADVVEFTKATPPEVTFSCLFIISGCFSFEDREFRGWHPYLSGVLNHGSGMRPTARSSRHTGRGMKPAWQRNQGASVRFSSFRVVPLRSIRIFGLSHTG